jgi:adenylate cyclase
MPGRAVAVITDDRIISMLTVKALRDSGLTAEIFRSTDPDLPNQLANFGARAAIVRGQLADSDAIALMESLRRIPAVKNIRYIVLSNTTDRASEYIGAGASAFVPIPFASDQLIQSVNEVLRRFSTVLYVDDSRSQHLIVVPHLRDAGYDVLQAYDGVEALEIVDKHQEVDLVLSDVDMPNKDGITLCGEIKEDPKLCRLPVILLTGREDEQTVGAAFSAGADDYLMKPVVLPELLARLERLLKPATDRRPERILVAASSSHEVATITKGLAAHGLQGHPVSDTSTAQQLLENGRYDLAIIDYDPPRIDAVTLVRALRNHPHLRDFPVIMTSATVPLAEQIKMRSAGTQSFLVKPFPPERLLAEVERILANVRHRRQVAAMRDYLSDAAIEAIERRTAGDDGETRADVRFLTVVFIDIVGFTTLCESMNPHAVVRFLNTFFDDAVGIIDAHDGQIDKFIGDCIMAVFRREQHGAMRAVRCCQEIIEALPRLAEHTGINAQVRVGINSGPMVMGDIGSRHHRRDFTVIGDNVNVAARLQTQAEPNGIMISQATMRELPESFPVEFVGELAVRGRRDPVLSYRVIPPEPEAVVKPA